MTSWTRQSSGGAADVTESLPMWPQRSEDIAPQYARPLARMRPNVCNGWKPDTLGNTPEKIEQEQPGQLARQGKKACPKHASGFFRRPRFLARRGGSHRPVLGRSHIRGTGAALVRHRGRAARFHIEVSAMSQIPLFLLWHRHSIPGANLHRVQTRSDRRMTTCVRNGSRSVIRVSLDQHPPSTSPANSSAPTGGEHKKP